MELHEAHRARLVRIDRIKKDRDAVRAYEQWKGINPEPYWPQTWVWDLIDFRPKRPTPPRLQQIIAATADYYNLSEAELLSSRRTHHVVIPRQVAMYVAKILTRKSLPEIGRGFDRDHTTVLHSVRKMEVQSRTQTHIATAVSVIKRRLGFDG